MTDEDENIRTLIEDFMIDKNKDLDENSPDYDSKLRYEKVYFINDSDSASESIADDYYDPYYLSVNSNDTLSLRPISPSTGLTNTIT
jgi:hypothetical protein